MEDVPGRAYARLVDDTAILVDRAAAREPYGAVSIRSTGDLNVAQGMAGRRWIRDPDVSSMPAPPDVWERMYELHALTLQQPTGARYDHRQRHRAAVTATDPMGDR